MGPIDPELLSPLEAFLAPFGGSFDLSDIPAFRAKLSQKAAAVEAPPLPQGLTCEDRKIPGPPGAPEVSIRIYWPTERSSDLPALLWIHGGGYMFGCVADDDLYLAQLIKAVACVVVSVEYRLAPENPFPAPLEDCYAALLWLSQQGAVLGINPSRIAIGGKSAGGGLAAGLALLARDRGEVKPIFQLLIYPMIDDRNILPAGTALSDTLLWNRENNLIGWRSYLGGEPGRADVSPYAAAARASDLTGLPPTFIAVGDADLFFREDSEYAHRLLAAGVPTELHVVPGAYHGFDVVVPGAAVTSRFFARRDQALKRALRH
jgi:acetyl esterase/lipase